MDSTRSMTSGSPAKLILFFALPLMLGNLFQQLYTVADAMIVGQVLGVSGIAAVGSAEWMIWLSLGMIQGFTQGFSIQTAQEFGAQKYDRLRRAVINSVFLCLISAAVMLAAGQIFAAPLLHLMHTPDAIFPDALLYMRIMFWGIPVTMAYNLLASVLRSLGDGKTPLYAMVSAAILNIVLDLLFVPVFGTGVGGAAAATVIAQFFSAVYCFAKIRKIEVLHMEKSDLVLDTRLHMRLWMLGFPMAFQNAVISVGGMIVQSVINRFGVIFIAGFTATNKLYGMLEVAATSYGFSMTTYAGQNLGAGKIKRIRTGYRWALLIALVTSLIISAVMIFGGRDILRCFISGDAKTVEDALAVAYHYLFIMAVCLPVLYYLHVTRSCIQGMGNTVLPMMSGFAEFFMRTGCALLLPRMMGQEGIFYAEIAAWAGADLVLFFSFFYCTHKLRTPDGGFHG